MRYLELGFPGRTRQLTVSAGTVRTGRRHWTQCSSIAARRQTRNPARLPTDARSFPARPANTAVRTLYLCVSVCMFVSRVVTDGDRELFV